MKFTQALIGLPATDYVAVAAAAEAAGFSGVALSDHIVYPSKLESRYPYTPDGAPQFEHHWDWPDPWVAVGAMASATTSLEFVTNVFVLPAREPLMVAKSVGSAAVLSGGRVSLGIGAGWMREEMEMVGQRFAGRGKRMDEMIEVLRATWAGGEVEWHGEHYDFPAFEMRPAPPHQVPILVGGHSEVALRRAARLDGWIGVNYSMDQLAAYCEQLDGYREEAGTADSPFQIVASPWAVPDAETVERLEQLGVTTLLTSAWMAVGAKEPESREHAIDCIGRYAERWIAPLGGRGS